MDEDCPPDCLFLYEPGCTDCRACAYCGRYLFWSSSRSRHNWDHIRPRKIGGVTVVPTCEQCNKTKKSMGLKSWLRYIRDSYTSDYWRSIVEFNKRKRNSIARVVRDVRDENI